MLQATGYALDSLIDFRRCLGRFATGVTVITCSAEDGAPRGITANSFSSVSLEPPLVLWNIAKVSRFLGDFLGADHFGINVLRADQQPLAAQFARSDVDVFDGVDYKRSPNAVPRLTSSLAWFECSTRQIHDCGDHHIIIGEVLDFTSRKGDPLLFYGSRYRRLGAD